MGVIMKKIIFEIPYPDKKTQWTKPYSMNAIYAGKHWAERAKDKEYWYYLTAGALNRAKIERKLMRGPASITFFWNDGLDLDNHAYIAKMITDSLKGILIRDDGRRFYQQMTFRFWDENRIKVEIEEYDTVFPGGEKV